MEFDWSQVLHDAEQNIIGQQWQSSHGLQRKPWGIIFRRTVTSEALAVGVFVIVIHP
jgi:hypothetical protein